MRAEGRGALPADVYWSFVSSLYQKRQTLTIGMLSHAVTFLLVYAKVRDPAYIVPAILVAVIWLFRMLGMRRFDRLDPQKLDRQDIRRWENTYNIGAFCVTAVLGIACGYSLMVTSDSFAQLACISVTLGTMVSVVGRNFGSKQAVSLLTYSACLPIVFSLLALQDIFMAILAVLILPLIVTTRTMANGVREFLYRNVLAAREIATIADRLDTALNNMTHGLFMLDKDHRILLANRRACEMLHLGDQARLKDCHLDVVLRYGVRRSFLDAGQLKRVLVQLDHLIQGGQSRALIPFSSDMYLEFSASRREDGGIVLIFEDVTARIRADQKILHMVRYDTLTGLANRDYFGELVSAALLTDDPEPPVGFMLLDIDEFKHVNDVRGHGVGDSLLCAVSERLKKVAAAKALVGRLVGDEFMLFYPNDDNDEDIHQTMRAFHRALAGDYTVEDQTFRVSLSAGYAVAPRGEFRLEEMQIRADLALFEAKAKEKGVSNLFVPEMDARYLDRQSLKEDLRTAVNHEALTVVYQPMTTPDGAHVECFEALSRWVHPERGEVPTAQFIRIAEEINVISEITALVLRRACRDCLTWPDSIAVSVNLSAHDLRDEKIIGVVMHALLISGLPAERLHLEVTESCLLDEPVKVSGILKELRMRGITIALDDFGTGYSSLSYLDALPVDIIKVDRAFVRDIVLDGRRFKLLRGIVHLARELGLKIVVEGVETDAQLQLLVKYNCADLVQGYVFSIPVVSKDVKALLVAFG